MNRRDKQRHRKAKRTAARKHRRAAEVTAPAKPAPTFDMPIITKGRHTRREARREVWASFLRALRKREAGYLDGCALPPHRRRYLGIHTSTYRLLQATAHGAD